MRIVLIGGGGHASGILGVFEAFYETVEGQTHPVIGFVDDGDVGEKRFAGRNVKQLGSIDDLKNIDASHYILAIGFSKARKSVFQRIADCGLTPAKIIHPRAELHDSVTVGEGGVVMACVAIGPGGKIGNHVYIAAGSTIEHDCHMGDFVTVMPNSAVSGDTMLGEACLIGTNATVLQGLSIGAGATVGAGAVVLKDVPAGVTVIGNPARIIEKKRA